jgi:Ca2+-binding EF-hand superfamily protein
LFLLQNGFVELKEFGKIVELLHFYDEINKVFEELDTNGDHRISFSEFKKGFHLLNEDYSDEHYLKDEFNKIDTNHGGFILFDEVRIFSKILLLILFCSSACIWQIER